jgi:hypothetical protein
MFVLTGGRRDWALCSASCKTRLVERLFAAGEPLIPSAVSEKAAVLYRNPCFPACIFKPRNLNRRQQRRTKSRSSPRPLFLSRQARDLELVETASLPSIKWIEGLSLVAAALPWAIRGQGLVHSLRLQLRRARIGNSKKVVVRQIFLSYALVVRKWRRSSMCAERAA